jgi:hypothetical protein
VRGLVWTPYQRSEDPEYREILFDGAEERVTFRACDLRSAAQVHSGSPATYEGHGFERGDRVRVRGARSGTWKTGTVRHVVCSRGEQVARDEYVQARENLFTSCAAALEYSCLFTA